MGRTELILLMALILFVAFAFGWLAHVLLRRFNRVDTSNVAELDQMASALHEAEEARDQAIEYMQGREAELSNYITQIEAELQASMDGLGEARRESGELRAYIEANTA